MVCNCGRPDGHHPTCLVAQAMRWRCPHCKSRRRPDRKPQIRHTNLCPLKEYQP